MEPRIDHHDWDPKRQMALDLAAKAALLAAKAAREAESSGPREWSQEERVACVSRAMAGQRVRSERLISRAIEDFGGLPASVEWGEGAARGRQKTSTLELAAQDPTGFGFELFAEGVRAGRDLREYLGAGLGRSREQEPPQGDALVSAWDLGLALAQKMERGPVAVCLAKDNAPALARLLSAPDYAQALMEMEPEPARTPWPKGSWNSQAKAEAMARDLRAARVRDGQHLELSLLRQALASRAWACAKLLLELPEFSTVLSKGELGAAWPRESVAVEGEVHWIAREDVWSALVGDELAVRRMPGPRAVDEEGRQKRRRQMLGVALRMWELSPEAARAPDRRGRTPGERVAVGMWRLGSEELAREAALGFEAAGCSIDWEALGERVKGRDAERMRSFCLARAERLALDASSSGRGASKAKATL